MCKIIIDCESCINGVLNTSNSCLGLPLINHYHPYHVKGTDTTFIPIKNKFCIKFKVQSYDVLPKNVGNVIIGRP